MKDTNSIFSTNTHQSIRTNYNNYKKKIKRFNSRPSISRTQEFFNNEINKMNNNKTFNNINYNYENNQNYNDSNFMHKRQNYSMYYPSEETSKNYQQITTQNYDNQRKNQLYPNTKRVLDTNYQEPPKILKHINTDNTPKDDWAEMLYHSSNDSQYSKKRISNSKTFQSSVFPKESDPIEKVRHNRETKYSDRLHKTQITTLPGCIKRGKYDIKDDKNFNVRNTESYLYKMEHDYTSQVHFGPLTKEEEEIQNHFPIEQRYQGSYQRGVKDNDIFNLKMNNENKYAYGYNNEDKNGANCTGKRMFKNNNTFKSQIEFV